MKARDDFDYAYLSSLLEYDKESGSITWKHSRGKAKAGSEAGWKDSRGYIKITCNGRTYTAHRLAWLLHYKESPPDVVDHIRGVEDGNRISNLRPGISCVNQQNQRQAHTRNTSSKHIGVSFFNGRWRAKIYHAGKYIFLGYHKTEEDAANAYLESKRRIHVGCDI
ncbi:HNH endonuclease [Pseudomonas sp. NPDC096950]|uniref:HNH endonuclease n=1 Tax=Pseudomonas sp. NPDC096950 TaxID=3364485 RepID=UPI00383A77FC